MTHTIVTTPGGEELVLLPKAEFEALRDRLDAAEHARAVAEVAAGKLETLSAEETAAALAAPTPLAFWREKRGLKQKTLAATLGVSQSFLSEIEAGKKKGDPVLYLKMARALAVRMEDLVEEA
jgi:DNA-binding XRE family transcriptional regulator